ncbi:uncharacterized protein O3C94_016795 [Discoglossus pictus]
MIERILNHTLEIISLLTGEASLFQHLTNSRIKIKMNSDKKLAEKILNHALEIIYLLTEEGDIHRLKEMVVVNHQSLGGFGVAENKDLDLQDENDSVSEEEEENEIDEKDILQVTIQSNLCTGLHDDSSYPVSINEEGKYEREEKDIKDEEIQSKDSAKSNQDGFEDLEHEKELRVKEETELSNKKNGSLSKHITDDQTASCSSENMVEDSASPPQRIEGETFGLTCEKETNTTNLEYDPYEEKPSPVNETVDKESNNASCSTMSITPKKNTKFVNKFVVGKTPQLSDVGDKPYVCPDCEKGFTKRSQLIQHHRTHTGEKPYACFACEKRFITRTHLVIHERTHTGEKPYVCPECGKCFSQRSSLVNHHRIHTGEKPYVCMICEKGFYRRSDMEKHQRTHTGEKPYVCPDCGKRFYMRADLVKHHRTHTGEKPYVCLECGKGFSERSNLAKHNKTHTKNKP